MALTFLIDEIKGMSAWREIEAFLDGGESALRLHNLYGSSKTIVLSAVVDAFDRPVTVITPDNVSAERLVIDLHQLMASEEIFYFPPSTGSSIDRELPLKETMGRRMEALQGLAEGKADMTVIPCQCLIERIMNPAELRGRTLTIRRGEFEARETLIERLVSLGYRREYVVEEVGVFAVRGGVLDLYGFGMEAPVRMEFMGEELVSMRKFDIQTQRSSGEQTFLHILPMEERDKTEEASPLYSYLPSNGLAVIIGEALVRANLEGVRFPGETPTDCTDHHADRCLAVLDGMKRIFLEGLHLHSRRAESYDEPSPVSEIAPPMAPPADTRRARSLRFGTRAPEPVERDMKRLKEVVHEQRTTNIKTIILCDNYGQKERIGELLGEMAEECRLEVGGLETGFQIPEAGLAVYNDHEIFRRPRRLRYRRRYRRGRGLDTIDSISPGDYLVHVDYGIGRFEGLKVIRIHEGEVECLMINYRDGDLVYVPVEKLDMVDKYSGSDGAPPRMDRLGGKAWEKVKKSTRKGVREMAEKLLGLYARREIAEGYAFSEDTPWQLEMESAFAYEETPDQRRTLDEVKGDMNGAKAMDRLICGDVGFGKTEIAVRAAFKAVQDNKQVAILVPTTILAQQHYLTFSERVSEYPIVVEVLSRFRTPAQQKKVIAGLKKGTVDIVIGTHRLFSKDIEFNDLGLLIVDEEHRFGVAHKEKLKSLREGVDVLQLTATPLPRTLHLSLMGIRDISLISTPPQDRLPIVTYVAEFDREMIKEAIMKEVDRGGQVFFVHNRVQSIRSVASMLRHWLPEVRFAVAHGQMSERDLEEIMFEFMEGEIDVLVSTMIIGSGLDVPNANTLIVNRSDRLGLAQLYQLRGRVGRSYRRAHAYLFTPPLSTMSEEARQRLQVLEEYTELGSGYKIALRDMEIRGVGNILGREQHGYINAAGLEMYNRLLEEEVRRIRGEDVGRPEVDLVVELNSLLPDGYVADSGQRVSIYRRLSRAKEIKELDGMEEELVDRFGKLPWEAKNLLNMVAIKVLAGEVGIKSIFLKSSELRLAFERGRPERLADWDKAFKDRGLSISIEQRDELEMTVIARGDREWLDKVRKSLRDLN